MFATGETVGLAEWIVDDTPVLFVLLFQKKQIYRIPVIHQAQTFTRSPFVLFLERPHGRTDGHTPWVKLMTIWSAVAWWVKNTNSCETSYQTACSIV